MNLVLGGGIIHPTTGAGHGELGAPPTLGVRLPPSGWLRDGDDQMHGGVSLCVEEIERHWLSDPGNWANLLGYVRLGYGPQRAAMEAGTTKKAVDAYLQADINKAEQYHEAADFYLETVEGKLHDAVSEGEAWAISMVLKAERPTKYGTKPAQTTNLLVASAADLKRLMDLAETRTLTMPLPQDGTEDGDRTEGEVDGGTD